MLLGAPIEPTVVAAAASVITDAGQDSKDAPAPRYKSAPEARPRDPSSFTERSIFDGMRWLARHQNPDGSWSAASLAERCDKDSPCFDAHDTLTHQFDAATTGLALLCFLRAGFHDETKSDIVDTALAKRHNVGDIVKRGLDWLARTQNDDGSFSKGKSFVYNEVIATSALVQAFGAKHSLIWKGRAQRGIDFLQLAQRRSPKGDSVWGWRFTSRVDAEVDAHNGNRNAGPELALELSDSDISATALCTMVLREARDAGLELSATSLAGSGEFARAMRGELGSVAYRDDRVAALPEPATRSGFADHPALLSALGMCASLFASSDPNDPFLDLAAKRLMSDLPSIGANQASVDYAYWFFGALALKHLDGPQSPRRNGKYWQPWGTTAVGVITSLQDRTSRGCRNGGWLVPDRWSFGSGPIYATAMSVLALELALRPTRSVFRGAKIPNGRVGIEAPYIHRTDANGEAFELSSLAGRVVVLDTFRASELPDSLALNQRDALLERFRGRPLVVVGVCTTPGVKMIVPESARAHRETWRWIQAERPDDPLFDEYSIGGLDTSIVIDATGVIRGRDQVWERTVILIEELVSQAEK